MSRSHLFPSTDGLVTKALHGMIASHSNLALDDVNKVVFNTNYDRTNVSVISGGGSGHEPAWSGYVGSNLLTASISGDIFASPSASQVLAGIHSVPSDQGTLLVVPNYTGDCINFGLALEKATAEGHACKIIICGDDVSIPRGSPVGRRGLPGHLAVIKVTGGAAAAGHSLDEVYELGTAVAVQIASIAVTLDHCHVPGRAAGSPMAEDVIEIGTGPHNEPGHERLRPRPSPRELIRKALLYCLDDDPERGYVKFSAGDAVVLLLNNFGGMSQLEFAGLLDLVSEQLQQDWNIKAVRLYCGVLESSLNASAFSISLINITAASQTCSFTVQQIKDFLDLQTNTHWAAFAGDQTDEPPRQDKFINPPTRTSDDCLNQMNRYRIDPVILESALRRACYNLISVEPDLTRWDTILGDGDCGETLKTGAMSILSALDASKINYNGSIIAALRDIEDIVGAKMGGTLGGILGIFLVSLRTAAEANLSSKEMASKPLAEAIWKTSLKTALEHLCKYTQAQVGDRTVMDTLVPFVHTMAAGRTFDEAVDACAAGAEATRTMKPRFGRASYVGLQDMTDFPPDPGAWGLMTIIQGLRDGMREG